MNKDSLLIKISDYYNIKSEIFEELGVLDSLVYFDTPLFLNPKLLSECSIPEFKNSKQKIIEHYQTTINLLSHAARRRQRDGLRHGYEGRGDASRHPAARRHGLPEPGQPDRCHRGGRGRCLCAGKPWRAHRGNAHPRG